jgi:hypothetical protein
LQPEQDGWMKTCFDPNEMFWDLSFEGRFPCSQAWRLPIKNEVISFIPDTPSTNHKNFHEEGLSKIQFGRLYLLVNI